MIVTFCWPCISVYLFHYLSNLMHKVCFTISFISCLYMFRAHVLETCRGIKWNILWNTFCASRCLNSEISIWLCSLYVHSSTSWFIFSSSYFRQCFTDNFCSQRLSCWTSTVVRICRYKHFTYLAFKSDVWLTVHRNSVWIRKTN